MTDFKKYNNIAGIYKWENKINHKCYIGQSINLGSRLRHHIGNYKHRRYDTPLYRAFDKYGLDNFDVEVLKVVEELDNVRSILDELEMLYIKEYNSYGSTGYNQTKGGDGGILGYKFTEEQRKRTSENSKKAATKIRKHVCLKNIKSEQIFEFESISEAAKFLKCSHSEVSRLCSWSQLLIKKEWVGSFEKCTLNEREAFVKSYKHDKSYYKTRRRPAPGLKRTFNTPDGKKVIPVEQRNKIAHSLSRYYVEVYVNGILQRVYEDTKTANEEFFHFKNNSSVMDTVSRHGINDKPWRNKYTFRLINKTTTNLMIKLCN